MLSRAAASEATLAAEKTRAERRIADAQAKLDVFRTDLSETGQRLEQKAATVESLTIQLVNVQEDLLRVVRERAEEFRAREAAEIKVAVLESTVAAHKLAIDGLNATCEERRRTIADLRAQDAESAPLRRRLKGRADEIQALRVQLAQARAQIPPRPLILGETT